MDDAERRVVAEREQSAKAHRHGLTLALLAALGISAMLAFLAWRAAFGRPAAPA